MNGSAAKEDEFAFKYLVAPIYRHAAEGRILFAPLRASEFFLVDPNLRRNLDFRWIVSGGESRAKDDAVYVGLPAGATGGVAADSFVRWLLNPKNQLRLMQESEKNRGAETAFGVAGGFSALPEVNAAGFTARHPELTGKLPVPASVGLGAPLPPAWKALKSGVLAPWLMDAARSGSTADSASLDAAIAAYLARNPELVP